MNEFANAKTVMGSAKNPPRLETILKKLDEVREMQINSHNRGVSKLNSIIGANPQPIKDSEDRPEHISVLDRVEALIDDLRSNQRMISTEIIDRLEEIA